MSDIAVIDAVSAVEAASPVGGDFVVLTVDLSFCCSNFSDDSR